jgi:hypothetical protein
VILQIYFCTGGAGAARRRAALMALPRTPEE